ncbi:hypothetical protein [Mesorhizobium sp.]|uniref:hypothetical protein n=1 Tax=Mesorhizobium sp. TaxID=1871066 RepID=UPI000FE534AE|nr:hypothetical protein [Mesorhizobium sp.]RWF71879.1 MAG: hypothetical protein EOQ34_13980 [Mesorhizobium sp.]TIN03867.1 MAG: hypothetical protein E5Y38_06305 [Mesorhizobium sp.]TIQ95500.1 MAG: hypothetical protein E5X36_21880 [Mesorhizobium sp.]
MTNLINNSHAPDIFADDAVGFFTYAGNMRITCVSDRSDYSTSPIAVNRVVIGRLVMPVAAAEAMAKAILDQVGRMRAGGETPPNVTVQ